MIKIERKENCCGCAACQQICPRHCISMKEDIEGFLYPEVEVGNCVDCHLCEKVCPVLNIGESTRPLEIYGARCEDRQLLRHSSSGGIFTLLAVEMLLEGGVVYGAAFDENWEVKHIVASTKEDLERLRGSKYIQSRTSDVFLDVENHLKRGEKVLFSGTPCQISALKHFLRKQYDGLLCVDLICHGVPSPLVWRNYLKKKILSPSMAISNLKEVSFRDKSRGWKNFSLVAKSQSKVESVALSRIIDEPASRNLYMRGFLNNLYLRPSCHKCSSRGGRSGSDITLGDFWGVQRRYPEFHDALGVSLVLANTSKGKDFFDRIDCLKHTATYDDVLDCNKALVKDYPVPLIRKQFFDTYAKKGTECIDAFCRKLEPGKISVLLSIIKNKYRKITGKGIHK